MAQRFLAVVPRQRQAENDPERKMLSDLGLQLVVHTESLLLWTNEPANMIATPSDRIQVLGRLFSRSDHPVRPCELDPDLDRRNSVPALLSERYWGNYIAFCQSTLGSVQVYRDPSGGIPCYVLESSERVILFSDIELAIAAGLITPEIDWNEVVTCLAWPALRSSRTALRDVYEIPQGWSLGISGSYYCGLTQIWSPWSYVEPTQIDDEELSEILQATVTASIRALRGEFRRVQLCLSGGLDSSIVAAAIGGTDTVCLNLVADGVEGDERRHAALVARAFGLEMLDRRYRLDQVDITASSARHLPRPVGAPGRMSFDRANLEFAAEQGTEALFTGFGGDNVFCLMRSGTPIADRLRANRPSLSIWQTVADVCRLTDSSIWTALNRAMRKLPASAAPYRWKNETSFLTRAALAEWENGPVMRGSKHQAGRCLDGLPISRC
jgi:asparagine synthase (glutamine-hydrolysing)